MKKRKRFLSLLLCTAMCFSLFPATVFAETDEEMTAAVTDVGITEEELFAEADTLMDEPAEEESFPEGEMTAETPTEESPEPEQEIIPSEPEAEQADNVPEAPEKDPEREASETPEENPKEDPAGETPEEPESEPTEAVDGEPLTADDVNEPEETDEDAEPVKAASAYDGLLEAIELGGDYTVTEDLVIDGENDAGETAITVASGATLTIAGSLYTRSTLSVDAGGSLVIGENGYLKTEDIITVNGTARLTGNAFVAAGNYIGGGSISLNDESQLHMHCGDWLSESAAIESGIFQIGGNSRIEAIIDVPSAESFNSVLGICRSCPDHIFGRMRVHYPVTVAEDLNLTAPKSVGIEVRGDDSNASLTVNEGVTLTAAFVDLNQAVMTVNGTLITTGEVKLQGNAELGITGSIAFADDSCLMNQNGWIHVKDTLNPDAQITGLTMDRFTIRDEGANGRIYYDNGIADYSDYDDSSELLQAISQRRNYTLTQNTYIAGSETVDASAISITIPEGLTLTVAGRLTVSDIDIFQNWETGEMGCLKVVGSGELHVTDWIDLANNIWDEWLNDGTSGRISYENNSGFELHRGVHTSGMDEDGLERAISDAERYLSGEGSLRFNIHIPDGTAISTTDEVLNLANPSLRLTVEMGGTLDIGPNSRLTVANGGSLRNEGNIQVSGTLTVEESGVMLMADHMEERWVSALTVNPGGRLVVNGVLLNDEHSRIFLPYSESVREALRTVTGIPGKVPYSMLIIDVGAETVADFETLWEEALGYPEIGTLNLCLNGIDVSLTKTVPENFCLIVNAGSSLTVPKGTEVDVYGEPVMEGGRFENDGTLNVFRFVNFQRSSSVFVNNGILNLSGGIGVHSFHGDTAATLTNNGRINLLEDGYLEDSVTVTGPGTVGNVEALPSELKLSAEYLILTLGDDGAAAALQTEPSAEEILAHPGWVLSWGTESGTEATVTVNPKTAIVTATDAGTDYVTVTLSNGLTQLSARCRVDVLDSEQQGNSEITATLPVTKITTEIRKTDYAKIPVILKLEQNVQQVSASGVTLSDGTELPHAGMMIEKAEFVGNDKNEKQDIRPFFALRVADDRTLEIVPIIDVTDESAVKSVAGSYKSAVKLTLSDGAEITTAQITLTVKKSQPKLSAAPVKLNRFIIGHSVPLVITGGTVSRIIKWEADQKVNAIAAFHPDNMTVEVINNARNGSGKYTLTCELADWAVPATVTVSVSSAYTAPKLSFKPASLTLSQNVVDSAATDYTLVGLDGAEHEISGVHVYEGGADVTEQNILSVDTSLPGTVFMFLNSEGPGISDGKKHTYKIYPLVDNQEISALTLTVLAAGTKASLVAKASGTIDTAVKGSPVTVTVTGKNCNGLMIGGSKLTIRQMQKGKVTMEDAEAEGLFRVNYPDGFENRYTITGTEKLKDYVKGYTYSLTVSGDLVTMKLTTNEVKLPVKTSAKTPAPSVTMKAEGSIDVLRPGTEIVLTPTFKNWFDYDETRLGLRLNNPNLDYRYEDGVFTVFAKEGADVNPALKQVWMTYAGEDVSKPVSLSLKMGKAVVAQSTRAITLSKNDCYDRQSVVLSLSDSSLYDIRDARVELVDKSGVLAWKALGNGEYAIGYKDSKLPANIARLKSTNVKLNVFLLGNGGTKANATLSIKVTFA